MINYEVQMIPFFQSHFNSHFFQKEPQNSPESSLTERQELSEFSIASLHDKLNFYGSYMMKISNDGIVRVIDYKVRQNVLILIKESYQLANVSSTKDRFSRIILSLKNAITGVAQLHLKGFIPKTITQQSLVKKHNSYKLKLSFSELLELEKPKEESLIWREPEEFLFPGHCCVKNIVWKLGIWGLFQLIKPSELESLEKSQLISFYYASWTQKRASLFDYLKIKHPKELNFGLQVEGKLLNYLLQSLLKVNPQERPSCEELQTFPLFQSPCQSNIFKERVFSELEYSLHKHEIVNHVDEYVKKSKIPVCLKSIAFLRKQEFSLSEEVKPLLAQNQKNFLIFEQSKKLALQHDSTVVIKSVPKTSNTLQLLEDLQSIEPKQYFKKLIELGFEVPFTLRKNSTLDVLVKIAHPGLSSIKHPDSNQIEIDTRRINFDSPLMSTHYGKRKVQELLVTFFKIYPEFFYIQGLDSLCTVLLVEFQPDTVLIVSLLHYIYKEILLKFIRVRSKQLYFDEVIRKFENLLEFCYPEIYLKFRQEKINSSIFLTPWFVTLFASLFMSSQVARLWDFILLFGFQSLFLLSGVILHFQFKEIQQLKSESILAFFSQKLDTIPHNLLQQALTLKESIPNWLLGSLVDLSSLKAEHIYKLYKSGLPLLVIQIDISEDVLLSSFSCRIKEQDFAKNIEQLVSIIKEIANLTVILVNKKGKDLVSQVRDIYKLRRLCSCSDEEIHKLKDNLPSVETTIPSTYKEIASYLRHKYALD